MNCSLLLVVKVSITSFVMERCSMYSFVFKLAWGNSLKTGPESGSLKGQKLASIMRRRLV